MPPRKKPAPPEHKAASGPPENKAAADAPAADDAPQDTPETAPARAPFGFIAPIPAPEEGESDAR